MNISVYVDGESHYERTLALWRSIHGEQAALTDAVYAPNGSSYSEFPEPRNPPTIVLPHLKFFWDTQYGRLGPALLRSAHIDNAAYFTTFTGDDAAYHSACVEIRTLRFDPQVVRERAQLSSRRADRLNGHGVIEKAKGVDTSLAVRALEDGYRGIYDMCYLFTSDVDFLPMIRALQRVGRKVIVFGYQGGLSERSELEYVPDGFVNLTNYVHNTYQQKPA